MKYENAADVLPADLLKRVQKFAAGKLIYIPGVKTKAPWGEASGTRAHLAARNDAIRRDFLAGASIEDLAEKYCLSPESVRKIAYTRNAQPLKYRCAASSAEEFSERGRLEEWVHAFLLSDGHNKAFSDGLKLFPRYYHGPVLMDIRLFERCCGPEDGMQYPEEAEWFEKRVRGLCEAYQSSDDLPPLIVNYAAGKFSLNDGNHRHEALRRLGRTDYPVILWATEKEDCEAMLKFLNEENE